MKKYNYFDDDIDESEETEGSNVKNKRKINKKPKSNSEKIEDLKALGKKILPAVKYIISVIGVNLILFGKSVFRFLTSKTKKKSAVAIGFFAVFLTVVIIVTTVSISITASSDKQNTNDRHFATSAYEICLEYNEKYGIANYKYMNSEYNVKGCMLTGLCIAREIDFNNDGISELLLGYNDNDEYNVEVWGFHGKEFKQFYSGKPIQRSDRELDVWFGIYSDDKDYCIAEHSGDNAEEVTVLKLSGDTFKKKTTCEYDESSLTYTMHRKNVTDDFEKIRFAVLRESTAANTVDSTLTTIDALSQKAVKNDKGEVSDNADSETQNPMYSAYDSIIEDYNNEYGKSELVTDTKMPEVSGLAAVELIDFNDDGNEELMLIYQKEVSERETDKSGDYVSVSKIKYFCDIYSYNGDKAVLVYQNEGLSNYMDDTDAVYMLIENDGDEKKLCFNNFSYTEKSNNMKAVSKIVAFNGERFEIENKYVVTKEYGYYKFSINGESSYRSKFTESGGYSAPFFDGTRTYDSSQWQIIYLKVDKDDLSQIKNLPARTEEIIKKLNPDYNTD